MAETLSIREPTIRTRRVQRLCGGLRTILRHDVQHGSCAEDLDVHAPALGKHIVVERAAGGRHLLARHLGDDFVEILVDDVIAPCGAGKTPLKLKPSRSKRSASIATAESARRSCRSTVATPLTQKRRRNRRSPPQRRGPASARRSVHAPQTSIPLSIKSSVGMSGKAVSCAARKRTGSLSAA